MFKVQYLQHLVCRYKNINLFTDGNTTCTCGSHMHAYISHTRFCNLQSTHTVIGSECNQTVQLLFIKHMCTVKCFHTSYGVQKLKLTG